MSLSIKNGMTNDSIELYNNEENKNPTNNTEISNITTNNHEIICYGIIPARDTPSDKKDWNKLKRSIDNCEAGNILKIIWVPPIDTASYVATYCNLQYQIFVYPATILNTRLDTLVCSFVKPRSFRQDTATQDSR
jgi:hypothetical protein